MSTKDISQYTPEELIQLAKNPIQNPDMDKTLPQVRRFIISEEIKSGKDVIPAMIIYDRYRKWADKDLTESPVNVTQFFKKFKTYFETKQTKIGMFYLLDSKGFDLRPEAVIDANREWSPSEAKKRKQEKEKRQQKEARIQAEKKRQNENADKDKQS